MIQQIISDSKSVEADATANEQDSQAAYESFVKDSNKIITKLSKAVEPTSRSGHLTALADVLGPPPQNFMCARAALPPTYPTAPASHFPPSPTSPSASRPLLLGKRGSRSGRRCASRSTG